jgi:hypothetical protein
MVSAQNLFAAWETFKEGKRNKPDVAEFEQGLEKYIFQLHRELREKTYHMVTIMGFGFEIRKCVISTKQRCATVSRITLYSES